MSNRRANGTWNIHNLPIHDIKIILLGNQSVYYQKGLSKNAENINGELHKHNELECKMTMIVWNKWNAFRNVY